MEALGVVVSLFLIVLFAAWEIALPADKEPVSPFHHIGLMPLRVARSGIDGVGARGLSADSSLASSQPPAQGSPRVLKEVSSHDDQSRFRPAHRECERGQARIKAAVSKNRAELQAGHIASCCL